MQAAERTLSIVVGTTQPWPEVQMTLDSIYPQALASGTEVLILSSDSTPISPAVQAQYPGVRWMHEPGLAVYELRALGAARASGMRIATTEDHVRVSPDWCQRLLDLHARHPDRALIAGGIDNGSTTRAVYWAHHYVIFGSLVLTESRTTPDPNAANTALLRTALADAAAFGKAENFGFRDMLQAGSALVALDLRVTHVQPLSLARAASFHFINGRMIAGGRRLRGLARLGRLLTTPALPAHLVQLRARQLWQSREHRNRFLRVLPGFVWLACAHALGEFTGYVLGPGDAGKRLR